MKKFKYWLTNKNEEVQRMLFPPLINERMLEKTFHELKNGEIVQFSIASVNDLEDIVTIQEDCYNGAAPWGRVAVNNELRNKRVAFFLMAHHNNRAVAFIGISARQNSLHVTNIATIPAYQKNGIATGFIEAVIGVAKALEKKRVTLEVRMSNETAKSLYRKIGFSDTRIKRNYYQNNGEDALDMVYLIDGTDEYNDPQSI